ncbi:SIR2 family protein [Mycoplasma sp. HU2014]|uniref:SIR2 family protein n=1 Tax=Mycoplasma sp. HU2014 TaxID=1664275 RepID=UPI00067B1C11|nr:SIR2 family protein [Mycoplasma sp. HU2014]KNG79096.1 SIR2-like domain containing protein [Mycoplasma sp. HU2014]
MSNGQIDKKYLINKLEKSIKCEELAAFIGAGISVDSGFVMWSDLLKEPASDIGLNIEKENDLINLAQYYSNMRKRSSIDELIKENFGKISSPSKNHMLLAQLPITTFWTTNYDKLIEKALESQNKNPFVKTTDQQLRITNRNFDAIVYKLHGDVDNPEDVVITRNDYEEFGYYNRKLFRQVLEGDLLTKTFIFLGFSFNDPNFNYVIAKLRVLLEPSNTRTHYCIMKRVNKQENETDNDFQYRVKKQELQIQDLERYGIFTCLVDEYNEITEILQTLVDMYKRKTIFISGSADKYDGFKNENDAKLFLYRLAYKLAENGYHIVNGNGKGIGDLLVSGITEFCFEKNKKISDYLTVIPFPQNNISKRKIENLYMKNREQMIEKCGVAIFVFGNKNDNISEGVMKEYELTKEKKLIPLPIKITGGSAKHIFDLECTNNIDEIKNAIKKANVENIDNINEIVENILASINLLNNKDVN